jgi:hypothetical protein
LQKILDAETIQAAEGIRVRAEMIKKGMIDWNGQAFDPEQFVNDMVGS